VSSSAIGSVLESMPGSALESILRAYLGAYCQAGWECHRVQLGASLRACPGVYLRPYLEVDLGACNECIWQFGFKFVECSMIYSIKRT